MKAKEKERERAAGCEGTIEGFYSSRTDDEIMIQVLYLNYIPSAIK